MRRHPSKIQVAAWLGVAAILLVFQTDHPLDSDEGVVLTGAWNLLNGRLPYRDFFCVLPPGSFYLVSLAWRVFGESYLVANALACASLVAGALGVQHLCRLATGSRWAPVAALLFVLPSGLWPLVNHGSFSITWVVWAAVFFARGVERRRGSDLLVAGLLNGISMLFLLQRGLAVLGAFAAYLVLLGLRERREGWWGRAALVAGASLLPPLLLGLAFPPAVLLENLVLFPLAHYLEVNRVPLLALAGVLLAAITGGLALRRSRSRTVWGLLLLQAALLASALPRPDLYHLTIVLFPFYALLPLAARTLREQALPWRLILAPALGFPVAFVAVAYAANAPALLATPRVEDLKTLAYLRERCGEAPLLYAGPFLPGLYFESRRLGATPYDYLFTGFHTPEQFEEAAAALARRRPQCAVLGYALVAKFGYRRANPVDRLLAAGYRPVLREGALRVYRLKER